MRSTTLSHGTGNHKTAIKMGDRYYIPKPEEFHVGFRFERSVEASLIDGGAGNTWGRDQIRDYADFDRLGRNENLRVKYPDRDDLEELGWEVEHYDNMTPMSYSMRKDEMTKYILSFYGKKAEIRCTVPPLAYRCFMGTIKDYNELRKQMEVIGIIENKH